MPNPANPASHPDALLLQDYVQRRLDPGGVAEHLEDCGLCATLALAFRPSERVNVVDPTLYADKQPFRSGGMGKTYTARDLRIGREVVIKEPAEPNVTADPGATLRMDRRLLRERAILGLMEHPAVVPIYETGQWPDGTPFFAMRRIHGPTLAETIAARRSFAQRIVRLPQLISIIEAVGHAHARGIVHRDLSPDNMMIGKIGEPYVIDWGIATLLDHADEQVLDAIEPAEDGMTKGGLGKDPYAPREQRLGEPPQTTFDVYSLGVTLHHLLAGRVPERAADGTLEPLPRECPEELASIVRRATAPEPSARFRDAGELAGELARYRDGKLVEAHRYTIWARATRWVRRHRTVVAVVVACAIAVPAVYYANQWRLRTREAQQQAQAARSHAAEAEIARQAAQHTAAQADANRDVAMDKWAQATARAKALTRALKQERLVSTQEGERLALAMEAERTAAQEAMDLKVVAETARHDAEAATMRAQTAEQSALERARSAQRAQRGAERRAEVAEQEAQHARHEASIAIDSARDARLALEAALEVVRTQEEQIRLTPDPAAREPPEAEAEPEPESESEFEPEPEPAIDAP